MKTFLLLCEYRCDFEEMMMYYRNLPVSFSGLCNVEWRAMCLVLCFSANLVVVFNREMFFSARRTTCTSRSGYIESEFFITMNDIFIQPCSHETCNMHGFKTAPINSDVLFTSFAYLFILLWYLLGKQCFQSATGNQCQKSCWWNLMNWKNFTMLLNLCCLCYWEYFFVTCDETYCYCVRNKMNTDKRLLQIMKIWSACHIVAEQKSVSVFKKNLHYERTWSTLAHFHSQCRNIDSGSTHRFVKYF